VVETAVSIERSGGPGKAFSPAGKVGFYASAHDRKMTKNQLFRSPAKKRTSRASVDKSGKNRSIGIPESLILETRSVR
jgi:hypothetical protein